MIQESHIVEIRNIAKTSFDELYQDKINDTTKELLNDGHLKKLFLNHLSLNIDELDQEYLSFAQECYTKSILLSDILNIYKDIKHKMYETLIKENKLEIHYQDLEKIFLHILNTITQGYFYKELLFQESFYKKEFNETIFYRVHIKWMLSLFQTIHTPTNKTNKNLSNCLSNFTQLLDMPITDMLLKSDEDKRYLQIKTNELYPKAKSLFYYLEEKKIYEAYTNFKSIVANSMEIMHFLTKKILSHYGSKEESFARYIQLQHKKGVKGYLSCFNIAKLRLINKYKGNDAGNNLIKHLEEMIKAFFVALDEDVVYTRGQNGDFYIFYPNFTKEYLENIQSQILILLQNQGLSLEKEVIYPKIYIGTLPLHTNGIFDHLDKMLTYVISQAKETESQIFYAQREEEAQTIHLIEKSRQDINFVENALSNEKLEIFFQPIIDLETGKLFDVEVLARIKHGNSYITAGAFIKLIYELEVIVELDINILQKVLEYSDQIKKVTKNIFINVSPSSLKSKRYREALAYTVKKLHEKDLSPYFELTEEALLQNIEIIEELNKRCSVSFAVDDFGTGYSSLKTVADLAEKKVIALIKIDGSIVRDILNSKETLNILDATSYMTKKLNLHNVAEYIENEETLNKVKNMGIKYGQGHYFSQALCIEELLTIYGT